MQKISNYQAVTPIESYHVSWSALRHPSGDSLIAKVKNFAIDLFKNIGKTIANAGIYLLNIPGKVCNFFQPVTPAESAEEVTIEHNVITTSVYASLEEIAEELPPIQYYYEEEIEAPVQKSSGLVTGTKMVLGTAVVVALLAAAADKGGYSNNVHNFLNTNAYQPLGTGVLNAGNFLNKDVLPAVKQGIFKAWDEASTLVCKIPYVPCK